MTDDCAHARATAAATAAQPGPAETETDRVTSEAHADGPETDGVTKLRRLCRGELVVGAVLPGDLHDRTGRVLIRGGHVLGSAQLEFLANHAADGVYVGPAWPRRAASPREPRESADTDPQRSPSPDNSEPERHAWHTRVTVELEEKTREGTRRRLLDVITDDVSATGFGFFHEHYVHPGTSVRTQFASLPGEVVIRGVVRSCTLIGGTRHRVGVEFVEVRRNPAKLPSQDAPADADGQRA